MKKCTVIIAINSNKKTVSDCEIITCKGSNCNFFNVSPKNYETIHSLCKEVLEVLKYNGYTVGYTEEFGTKKLYNISIVDTANGKIDKFFI